MAGLQCRYLAQHRLNDWQQELVLGKKGMVYGLTEMRSGRRAIRMEALAMTGAKLREAMALLRSLKHQYPDDSDELLQQRFRKELESDAARSRAIIEDIYRELLQELTGRKRY